MLFASCFTSQGGDRIYEMSCLFVADYEAHFLLNAALPNNGIGYFRFFLLLRKDYLSFDFQSVASISIYEYILMKNISVSQLKHFSAGGLRILTCSQIVRDPSADPPQTVPHRVHHHYGMATDDPTPCRVKRGPQSNHESKSITS